MSKTFDFLKDYKGIIKVNGRVISKSEVPDLENLGEDLTIDLIPNVQSLYKVEVRGWMTVENNNNIDFHNRWNDGEAMPEKVMYGTIIDETPGMYLMELKTEDERYNWRGYVSKAGIVKMEEL